MDGKRPSKVGTRAREKWEQEMWAEWVAHQEEKRRHPERFRLAGAGRKPLHDGAEDHDEQWGDLFEPVIEDRKSALDDTPGLDEAFANPVFVLAPELHHDSELTEYSMREFDDTEDDVVTPRRYASGKLLGMKKRDDTARERFSEQELPAMGVPLARRLVEERRLRRAHGLGWNTRTIRGSGADHLQPIFAYSPHQGSVRFSHWWRRWANIFQLPKEKQSSRGKVVFGRVGPTHLGKRAPAAAEKRKEALARGRDASIERANARAGELAAEIQAMRAADYSYDRIAAEFSRRGIATARGGMWTAATVQRMARRAGVDLPHDSAALATS